MADALKATHRSIVFGVCEWGQRFPWRWASGIGAQLWRCAGDARDKWRDENPNRNPPYTGRYGILDMIDDNSVLSKYAGPGKWNDMDALMAGLYGWKGPSSISATKGCTDVEYQTQMSMWSMLSSPLVASNDIRTMNEITRKILLNKDVIALNQDPLGAQAGLKIKNENWYVFLKPLANGDYAVSVLNLSNSVMDYKLVFREIDLPGNYTIYDIWQHANVGSGKYWSGKVLSHETKVFRLKSYHRK